MAILQKLDCKGLRLEDGKVLKRLLQCDIIQMINEWRQWNGSLVLGDEIWERREKYLSHDSHKFYLNTCVGDVSIHKVKESWLSFLRGNMDSQFWTCKYCQTFRKNCFLELSSYPSWLSVWLRDLELCITSELMQFIIKFYHAYNNRLTKLSTWGTSTEGGIWCFRYLRSRAYPNKDQCEKAPMGLNHKRAYILEVGCDT